MIHSRISRSGFSLIELVIVVVIIGVVAAIAVPRLSRGAEAAGTNTFSNNLSQIVAAIERYHALNGSFPPQQPGKAMPSDIADLFPADRGNVFSAIGGGCWEYEVMAGSAIVTAKFDQTPDAGHMQRVDEMLDNADLSTGLFCQKTPKKYEFSIR